MPRDADAQRRWCFTLHNYTPDDEHRIQSLQFKYLIYGRETCPTTGTPHLQGYIEFINRKSLAALKLLIPRVSARAARGTAEENKTYCSKEDQAFYEAGSFTSQGGRTDLALLLSDIKEGKDYGSIIDTHPEAFFKYHVAIDKAMTIYAAKRNWTMHVIWCWGPTGTGKSHWAHEHAGEDVYRKPPGKWWDGYTGQHTVILDEFRPDWWPFYYTLLLFDKYPLTVEVKGSTRAFSSKQVIVTAPVKWDEMYRNQTVEKLNQLARRITETKYFGVRYLTGEIVNDDAPQDAFEAMGGLVPGFDPVHQRHWGRDFQEIAEIENDLFGF